MLYSSDEFPLFRRPISSYRRQIARSTNRHGFNDSTILEVLREPKRNFYLVNLHFKNWSCTPKAAPLPAWAYQVLWVNKRIGIIDPTAPVPAPMSPLNAPESPTWPDCQLPTPISQP